MQKPQEVDACIDFDADVATLQLGDRAYWILFEMKIYTIQQLCKKTPLDLLAHPNLGNKSLKHIQQALADR